MAKTEFDSNTDFTTLSLPLASTLQSSYWPRFNMLCQPGLEDQSGVELS